MRALVVTLAGLALAGCSNQVPQRPAGHGSDAALDGATPDAAAPPPLSTVGAQGTVQSTVDAGCEGPTSPGPDWRRLPAYPCGQPLWACEHPDRLAPLTFSDCGWAPACRWLDTPWSSGAKALELYAGYARTAEAEYLTITQLTKAYEQVVVAALHRGGAIVGALRRNEVNVGAVALGARAEFAFLGQEGIPGQPALRYQLFFGPASDLATYLEPRATVTTRDPGWGFVQMPLWAGDDFMSVWFAGNAVARVFMPSARVDVVSTSEASWRSKLDPVTWRDTLEYLEEERRLGFVRGGDTARVLREVPVGKRIAAHARDDQQVAWIEVTDPWGLPTTHAELWWQALTDALPSGPPILVGPTRGVRQGYTDRRMGVGGGQVAITALDLRVYDLARRTVRVAPQPPPVPCVAGTELCGTTWSGVVMVDAAEVMAVQEFGTRANSIVRLRLDALPEYPVDAAPEPLEAAP